MATSYPDVNPAVGGTVHAWAGKYGHRGALKEFVLLQVKKAAPSPIGTGALMLLADNHFGLQLNSRAERVAFKRHLRTQLQAVPNVIEKLLPYRPGASVHWRWRALPALGEIAQEAERNERAHSVWPEVGG